MLAQLAGELVHGQRLRKGLSQVELARSAQVSRSIVSRLERGRASVVQTDVLDRLFRALGYAPALGRDTADARRLARSEQRNKLELARSRHLRLALDLTGDEMAAKALIAKAQARVDLWRQKQSCSPWYIERWEAVLALPPRELARAVASFGAWEDAMFQNSPWSWAWS
jgi:DNA-binding XRE family transcriptional regulator